MGGELLKKLKIFKQNNFSVGIFFFNILEPYVKLYLPKVCFELSGDAKITSGIIYILKKIDLRKMDKIQFVL